MCSVGFFFGPPTTRRAEAPRGDSETRHALRLHRTLNRPGGGARRIFNGRERESNGVRDVGGGKGGGGGRGRRWRIGSNLSFDSTQGYPLLHGAKQRGGRGGAAQSEMAEAPQRSGQPITRGARHAATPPARTRLRRAAGTPLRSGAVWDGRRSAGAKGPDSGERSAARGPPFPARGAHVRAERARVQARVQARVLIRVACFMLAGSHTPSGAPSRPCPLGCK